MPFERNKVRQIVLEKISELLFNEVPFCSEIHKPVLQPNFSLVLMPEKTGKASLLQHFTSTNKQSVLFSFSFINTLFEKEGFSKELFKDFLDKKGDIGFLFSTLFIHSMIIKNKKNIFPFIHSPEPFFLASFGFSVFYEWMKKNRKEEAILLENINTFCKVLKESFTIVLDGFDKKENFSKIGCEKIYQQTFKTVLEFLFRFDKYEWIKIKFFCEERTLNSAVLDFQNSSALFSRMVMVNWSHDSLCLLLKKHLTSGLPEQFIPEEQTFLNTLFEQINSPACKKLFKEHLADHEETIVPKFFFFTLCQALHSLIENKSKTKNMLNGDSLFNGEINAAELQDTINSFMEQTDITTENVEYMCCPEKRIHHLTVSALLFCKKELEKVPCLENENTFFMKKKTSNFLKKIVTYHYTHDKRLRGMIKDIVVVTSKEKGKTFAILTTENTVCPFSYSDCFFSFPMERISEVGKISKYLRRLVLADTNGYKKKYIEKNMEKNTELCLCEFTQKMVPVDKLTVEHVIPFSQLIKEWAEKEHIDLDSLHIIQHNPMKIAGLPYPESIMIDRWKKYHANHAILQCVHLSINAALADKGRSDTDFCTRLCQKYRKIFETYQIEHAESVVYDTDKTI